MWFDIFMIHLAWIMVIVLCFYFNYYYGKGFYRWSWYWLLWLKRRPMNKRKEREAAKITR